MNNFFFFLNYEEMATYRAHFLWSFRCGETTFRRGYFLIKIYRVADADKMRAEKI